MCNCYEHDRVTLREIRRFFAGVRGAASPELLLAERSRAWIGRPFLACIPRGAAAQDVSRQTIIELAHELGERLGIAVVFCSHDINPLLHAADKVLYVGNGKATIGTVDEVINGRVLSSLYGTPINVMRVDGRIFVLAEGIELEGQAHAHDV